MNKMDLATRIEHCAFLGREFLVYLWWKSEHEDGDFLLRGVDGPITLAFESQIVLERKVDVIERTRLTGPDPSGGATAKEALRHGELPTRCRIRITHAEREYAFTLSEDLSMRTVKLPALLTEEVDDQFMERLGLVDALEGMLDALLCEYLELRLSPEFRARSLPAMREFAGMKEAA